MDETEEISISTQTQHLPALRHWGLTVFVALSFVVLAASVVAAFS